MNKSVTLAKSFTCLFGLCFFLVSQFSYSKPQTRQMMEDNSSIDEITHIDQIELSKFFEATSKANARKNLQVSDKTSSTVSTNAQMQNFSKKNKNISKKVTLHDNNKEQKLLVVMESENAI